jgi:hypothetical protein
MSVGSVVELHQSNYCRLTYLYYDEYVFFMGITYLLLSFLLCKMTISFAECTL